ncbi:MAG: hypothetical protein ACJ74I_03500, partial [Gaiellaceae bacterium]
MLLACTCIRRRLLVLTRVYQSGDRIGQSMLIPPNPLKSTDVGVRWRTTGERTRAENGRINAFGRAPVWRSSDAGSEARRRAVATTRTQKQDAVAGLVNACQDQQPAANAGACEQH